MPSGHFLLCMLNFEFVVSALEPTSALCLVLYIQKDHKHTRPNGQKHSQKALCVQHTSPKAWSLKEFKLPQ